MRRSSSRNSKLDSLSATGLPLAMEDGPAFALFAAEVAARLIGRGLGRCNSTGVKEPTKGGATPVIEGVWPVFVLALGTVLGREPEADPNVNEALGCTIVTAPAVKVGGKIGVAPEPVVFGGQAGGREPAGSKADEDGGAG